LRKFQQFFALKFTSDRLKNASYAIKITLDEARQNGEVITINDSELIRAYFRYKNIDFDQNSLNLLIKTQRIIRKSENNENNRKKLEEISKKIEKMLFIEDFVNIEFKHASHYHQILKKHGFYINGTRFTPFIASAGMIRKNTAMFINNNIKHPLMDILENDRDESVPMVPAKFGAYFSLYSSSTLEVSFPRIAVVSDKELTTIRRVDFVTYEGKNKDDKVEEVDYPLVLNAWDGQGLISPSLAREWSDELELDYTFSSAIIRAPFMKGLVTVFDFHKFAKEVAKTNIFTDIYGNQQDVRKTDIIVSESMFKLWYGYKSMADYVEKCNKNQLGFSIAKVNPKEEKSHSRTSYQFLQVLDLDNTQVAKLCEPTVDWFRNLSGGDASKMLLYATGDSGLTPAQFQKMDSSIKAVLINPALADDRHIQKKFMKTLNRRKKDSYMGSILINANYQFMLSDPYAQACHIFSMPITPILQDGEHYSEYWLNKNITKVGAVRSPIVHHSEFNILNFKRDSETEEWYQHIHSGIIFPANGIGIDCVIHGGADLP